MDTAENNKLIAEFMGLCYCKNPSYHGWYKDKTFKTRICDYNSLKYHNDWNWLMEVVEQIEQKLPPLENDNSFNVTIGSTYYCVIQDSNGEVIEITGMEETKILSVYKAVVEFIKWYNTNKID